MTYLIISIYDGGYCFSVCKNGKIIDNNDEEIKSYKNIYYNNYNYEAEYAKLDFDFIVLCENGSIDILKEELDDKSNINVV